VVDKDSNHWIKKVFFQIVEEARRIVQKAAIGQQRIGASRREVFCVKALASWLYRPIYSVTKVAGTSSRTTKWAKEVWACCAETRTDYCLGQGTCPNANYQLLKVMFTSQPFTTNIDP
jgi:hypothetical protein